MGKGCAPPCHHAGRSVHRPAVVGVVVVLHNTVDSVGEVVEVERLENKHDYMGIYPRYHPVVVANQT